jgi:hypothetical protein
MRLLLFFIFCLPLFCFGQTGTISGNAFWKYNDFVGNKPDAGASVYVYPEDTASKQLQTQCDVQGNFRFEHVKPGKYLVVIQSLNTTTNGFYNYNQVRFSPTKKYLGFDLKELNMPLYDSVDIYFKNYDSLSKTKMSAFAINKWMRNVEKHKVIYENSIQRLMALIPMNMKTVDLMLQISVTKKVYLKELQVNPDETITVIADFGITYL